MTNKTTYLIGAVSLVLLVGCGPTAKPKDSVDPVMLKAAAYQARRQYTPANDATIIRFLDSMKTAVRNNDMERFAQLIHYPCRVEHPAGAESTILDNKKQFFVNSEALLTPQVREAILNTEIDKMFVNASGFRIGEGEIWFDPLKGITSFKSSR